MNAQELVANPSDSGDKDCVRWVLGFGAYGGVRVLVYAKPDHSCTAFDHGFDWIEENFPDMFCDDEVAAEYDRLRRTPYGEMDEDAMQDAEVDTISAGNSGRRMSSQEVFIVSEGASREDLAHLLLLGSEDA